MSNLPAPESSARAINEIYKRSQNSHVILDKIVIIRDHEAMRIIGYVWALPVTLVGLTLAIVAVASGGSARRRGGVLEVCGGAVGGMLRSNRFQGGGAAMTLGHVVLARDSVCLERSREHELVHVRQFERWGPLLLPAYWLISVWLWSRGFDPYLDHPFEPPPR